MFDYLVVGAGFAGAVLAERLARVHNARVLVIDRRAHVGGNAYDYRDVHGVLVHGYGPHVFHTNSARIFSYLSQFTTWRNYRHRVLASVNGQLVPLPVNLDTVNRLQHLELDPAGMERYLTLVREKRNPVRTSEDFAVNAVGRELYEKLFRGYTRKQWGIDPSELDPEVIARLPVRLDRDDRYFTDTYQAMPEHGFAHLFGNLLDHPNIKIELEVDYREVRKDLRFAQLIFTGPVDEYFGHRFGPLPYRSLEFRHETHFCPRFQPAAVINYPNDHPYTRVTEFKYLTGQDHPFTSIVYEYPRDRGDPFYPVPTRANRSLYHRYEELAKATANVHFVGRLGTYRYYNMDQVVGQALKLFARLTARLPRAV